MAIKDFETAEEAKQAGEKEPMEKDEAFDIIAEKVINAKVDSPRFAMFCNELLKIIDQMEEEW